MHREGHRGPRGREQGVGDSCSGELSEICVEKLMLKMTTTTMIIKPTMLNNILMMICCTFLETS